MNAPAQLNAARPALWSGAVLGVCLALAGLALRSPATRVGRALTRQSYNSTFALAAPFRTLPPDLPLVLVYLDRDTFQSLALNPAEPLPRSYHARLVRRLTAAGARAVVFDILFCDPGPDPEADRDLAAAIQANGRVILGAELSASGRATEAAPGYQAFSLALPLEPLRTAAAGWGITSSQIDDDFVARRLFLGFPGSGRPSLAWATAGFLGLPVTRDPAFPQSVHWVNYYDRPLRLPHVAYSAALDPQATADALFRDRVVVVGARPMTGGFADRRDEFRSPFYSWQDQQLFHPGAEVHALQTLNLLRGDWLRRGPAWAEAWALGFLGAGLGIGLSRWRLERALLVALAAVAATALLALGLFLGAGAWCPWLIVAGVQIPVAVVGVAFQRSVEWYRERRRLQAIRQEAERKIREQAALLDKARDAIFVSDLEGRLRYANPAAEALYGGALAELDRAGLGRTAFVETPGVWADARRQVMEQGEWSGELRQRTAAGHPLVTASRWTLLRHDDGRPQGILFLNTDITEQKGLEAQLLRAQRLDTIGHLAGGMAHDLNNALAPILMGVQMLQRRGPDPDTRRMLEVMEASTHRGADLVRQVLLFSRGREAGAESLSSGKLLREIEHLVRETFPRSVTVQALVPDDLWSIRGHATQVHQVLLNLCVNARDAMPRGGRLTLAADNVELDAAELADHPGVAPGAYVMFMVSDTGEGMPPEVRARIFEPFFTTKGEGRGTGIGLSTVATIIKSHRGLLRVVSEVGQGTSFEVYLPRAEAAPAPASAPAAAPRGQGELLLVIDDEESVRDLLATALAEHGYRVVMAGNGVEAMPIIQQRAGELRLVIMDEQMPLLDGEETFGEIQRLCPTLPVILASGQRDDSERTWRRQPQVAILPKPFPLDELLRLIHERLPASPGAAPAQNRPGGPGGA